MYFFYNMFTYFNIYVFSDITLMEAKHETTTRAFRLPKNIDSALVQKSEELGYLTPSEYLRNLVRKELEAQ